MTISSLPVSRRHLASFERCYAVACQLRDTTGAHQFVVRTENSMQPFRVSRHQPAEPGTIFALVA